MDGHRNKISIKKDPAKGNQASNYLLIACLSMTGIMGEKFNLQLERNGLLVD